MTPDKPGQDQSNGIHTRFHLGPTGINGVQEASGGSRGHLLGEEENQVNLRGVWGDNVRVLPLPLHGEVTRYIPFFKQRGRCRGRSFRDLRGVLSAYTEVSGMPGRRMSGKGKHPRETTGALHVLTLEGEVRDCTGGTGTTTNV